MKQLSATRIRAIKGLSMIMVAVGVILAIIVLLAPSLSGVSVQKERRTVTSAQLPNELKIDTPDTEAYFLLLAEQSKVEQQALSSSRKSEVRVTNTAGQATVTINGETQILEADESMHQSIPPPASNSITDVSIVSDSHSESNAEIHVSIQRDSYTEGGD